MWRIQRIDPYTLLEGKRFFACVGGGGKTSFSEYLARKSVNSGFISAVTTTTKIYARKPYTLFSATEKASGNAGEFVRIGNEVRDGKLTELSYQEVEDLGVRYDRVFIEADGAKGLPLKILAEYEPRIPPCTDLTFVVAGLDALGGRTKEMVFRWEQERLSLPIRVTENEVITPALFEQFFSDQVLLKDVNLQKSIIVLNKYDSLKDRSRALYLAKLIVRKTGGIPVIIASVRFRVFYLLLPG